MADIAMNGILRQSQRHGTEATAIWAACLLMDTRKGWHATRTYGFVR
jgi:hypothetical protein